MQRHLIQYKKLYLFILFSYFISWTSLLVEQTEYDFFFFLAKFGFTISAILVIIITRDQTSRNNILHYLSRFKLAYLFIGLSPLLAYIISIMILVPIDELQIISNTGLLDWLYVLLIAPSSGILFYCLFRGGLGEEIGLRGFILPFLAKKKSLFTTSLIIGIFWAVWHYPVWIPNGLVNLIAGTLATIAWSGIFTYLFAKTRSLGLVILLHATGNASDDILEWIFPSIARYDWEIIYILIIIVFGIIAFVNLRNLLNPFQESEKII
jgi:membrane protease YdiL (CAAX protease family)